MTVYDTDKPLGFIKISPTLFLILICVSTSLYILYQWLLPKPLPGIPFNENSTKSIWGDAPDMLNEISHTNEFNLWCTRQAEKLKSPICQVFVQPFSKPWILLADFREAQDIMMRRNEFDRSTYIIRRMGSMGQFRARYKSDAEWKRNCQWVQDLMTPSFLNGVIGPQMHVIARNIVSLWDERSRVANGRPFSASHDLVNASGDVMMSFAFGKDFKHTALQPQIEYVSKLEPTESDTTIDDEPMHFSDAPVHDFVKATHDATEILEEVTNSFTPRAFLRWKLQFSSWYRKTFAVKEQILREQGQISVQNLNAGEVESGFDHMMMREQKAAEKMGRNPYFEGQPIIDELFGEMIAGHHTTGAALVWIMKFLTENPSVQEKLRTALHASQPTALEEKRTPTFDELNSAKLPYLDAIIEETLRLHATTITREAKCDTELLGHRIPKGTTVFLCSNGPSCYSPSFSIDESKRSASSRAAKPRAWDETKDMRVFDPERWFVQSEDGEKEFDRTAGPQLVFGLGTRGCFGQRLAYMEMRIMTSIIVWNFDLTPVPESLCSHEATDGISHQAVKCFIRPKRITETMPN
ncbi:MAG: hypothetical protein Q9227_005447 [Pyrenula ochraceoflavens]